MQRETRIAVVGAFVAVILQIVLAPNIAFASIVPNILIVYAIVVAMCLPASASLWIAFFMGLASDLFGFGMIGSLSFLLVIATFTASRLYGAIADGRLAAALGTLMVFILAVNMLYAAFLIGASSTSILDAFIYRALPCTVYECAIGLVIYPLMSRLLEARTHGIGTAAASLKQLR